MANADLVLRIPLPAVPTHDDHLDVLLGVVPILVAVFALRFLITDRSINVPHPRRPQQPAEPTIAGDAG